MKNHIKKTGAIIICILFLSSCAVYHPLKIDRTAIDTALNAPDLKQLTIETRHIDHPILKSLNIDLQNGLSPDEAALLAVVANPAMRAIRDQKNIAAAGLIEAGLLPNPQLSASLDIPTGGDTAGAINAYGFSLGWDITALIGRKDRIMAAQSEKAAIDLTVAWEEWQVAESAKLQVLDVIWADKRLSLLNAARDDCDKNLAVIRKAVEAGEKTAADLAAAEAACSRLEQNISEVAQEREQNRLLLNQTLGLPPETDINVEKDIPAPGWPKIFENDDFMSGLVNRRPDLIALNLGYESQEARMREAILSQFPRINISLNRARDTGNIITTGPGIDIEFPFFDRGQGRIALERATRRKLYDEYMARIFDTRADIAAITSKIMMERERIAIAEKSAEALQRLVDTFKAALDQGSTDVLTYYQARQDLIAKRLEIMRLRQSVTDLGIAYETATCIYSPIENTSEHGTEVNNEKLE